MRHFTNIALLLGFAWACSAPARSQGQTWAVCVGVDDYLRETIQDLRFACADAKLFSQAMVDLLHVPKDHLYVFTSDAVESSQTPTRLNLIYRLEWLHKNVKPDDKVVFFFAGHGANVDNESFLMTEESDNRSVETLKASALGTKDLALLLQRAPASQTLTILDACRNDPAGKGAARRDERMPQLVIGGANQESAGLFSCSVGQRSWEWEPHKHGFFTYYLVEGMQGGAVESDGRVTLQSISNYLSEIVPAATRKAVQETQIPFVYYVGPSMKNWVLARSTKTPGKGPVVPILDSGVARHDVAVAQKVELEARLRVEEAKRREVESRLEALEKRVPSQSTPPEEVQKLMLAKELALKELLDTRKQLDEARIQLAARGGTTAEADLLLAEREQLKAENKVLLAKIAVLQGQLSRSQAGSVSLARSFQFEPDPAAEARVAEREKQALQQPTAENHRAAAEARIQLLLSESGQLRSLGDGVLQEAVSYFGARLLESEAEKANLQAELAAAQMQARIWQNRLAQAQQAQEVAQVRLDPKLSEQAESVALRQAEERFRAARQQNLQLLEDLRQLLKAPAFKRRWVSSRFYQVNSAAGMGDILDVPIKTGPELESL
jgi:hypothetical protein